jgi:hypothetical protein
MNPAIYVLAAATFIPIHHGTTLDGTELRSCVFVENYLALRRACGWAKAVSETAAFCEKLNETLDAPAAGADEEDEGTLGIQITLRPYTPATVVPCPFTRDDAWRYDAWDYGVLSVPKIRTKTRAKTSAGQQRAFNLFREECAAQKEQMLKGERLLRKAGFGKHSDSFGGAPDDRDRCPRCGGTYWTGRPLRCHDCHYSLRERRASEVPDFGQNSELYGVPLPDFDGNKRPRRAVTSQELLTTLLMRGDLLRANTEAKATRLLGISRILLDGWLPRDVAEETGENPETIRTHVDRIYRDIETLRGKSLEKQEVHQRMARAQRNPLIKDILIGLFRGFDA